MTTKLDKVQAREFFTQVLLFPKKFEQYEVVLSLCVYYIVHGTMCCLILEIIGK